MGETQLIKSTGDLHKILFDGNVEHRKLNDVDNEQFKVSISVSFGKIKVDEDKISFGYLMRMDKKYDLDVYNLDENFVDAYEGDDFKYSQNDLLQSPGKSKLSTKEEASSSKSLVAKPKAFLLVLQTNPDGDNIFYRGMTSKVEETLVNHFCHDITAKAAFAYLENPSSYASDPVVLPKYLLPDFESDSWTSKAMGYLSLCEIYTL